MLFRSHDQQSEHVDEASIAKQLHQMKVDMEQGVAKKNEALQQKVAEL